MQIFSEKILVAAAKPLIYMEHSAFLLTGIQQPPPLTRSLPGVRGGLGRGVFYADIIRYTALT